MLNNILGIIGGLFMGLAKPAKSYEMIIIGRFIIGLNCGKLFKRLLLFKINYKLNLRFFIRMAL